MMTSVVLLWAACGNVDPARGKLGILKTEGVVCEFSDSGKASIFEKCGSVLGHC